MEGLRIHAQEAVPAVFLGRRALRVTNGIVIVADDIEADLSVEVDLAVEGDAAYPGIAFRGHDPSHYELAYVQPHTTGMWDAVQYDPVLNGSNTWQLYHGPAWQAAAGIPQKRWFTLRVDAIGASAGISIIDESGRPQQPLTVDRMRYAPAGGFVGVWTFLPACFGQIRIGHADPRRIGVGTCAKSSNPGTVAEWELEGNGMVCAEETGIVNLNRLRPVSPEPAILRRRFMMAQAGELALHFGFSDRLEVLIDGQQIFSGENRYAAGGRDTRGYVTLGSHQARVALPAGQHTLIARVFANEPFGWGFTLAAHCPTLQWIQVGA